MWWILLVIIKIKYWFIEFVRWCSSLFHDTYLVHSQCSVSKPSCLCSQQNFLITLHLRIVIELDFVINIIEFIVLINHIIIKMAGVLFEDIFDVKNIDPEGKKFDRGKRNRRIYVNVNVVNTIQSNINILSMFYLIINCY